MKPAVRICLIAVCVTAGLSAGAWADSATPPSPDRAYIDSIIDSLVGAGVLTQEQANAMRASASEAARAAQAAIKPPKKKWYDTAKVSGYTQARYEYYTDADSGETDSQFRVRRGRVKLQFNPTAETMVEVEGDFAEGKVEPRSVFLDYTAVTNEQGTGIVRFGQFKMPFGFETPQSSGSRLPLERNWLSRWTFPGERDTGILYMWTRPEDHALFEAAKKNDFGTGDYGNISLGFVNGQGANNSERNSNKHFIARVAKPFEVQIGETPTYAELGASFFSGRYVSSATTPNPEFDDRMFGIHGYLAPNPFGLQAEYFTGETEGDDVDGWYVMGLWRPTSNPNGVAFVRYDEYNGPRKGKGAGRVYDVERTTVGYAHMLDANTRLTVEYNHVEATPDPSAAEDDMIGVQLMIKY